MPTAADIARKELERRVAQVELARRSLADFCRYVSGGEWKPAPWHIKLCEALEACERGDVDKLIVEAPPQHGKALALDTPVPTPCGWRNHGDLAPGDLVFNARGEPVMVMAVSPVFRNRRCYSVRTDCGDSIVADAQHEWRVRLCRKHKAVHDYSTERLALRSSSRAPLVTPHGALLTPHVALPIDPYVLGVWLGDGNTDGAVITSGDQDREWMRGELERCGVTLSPAGKARLRIGLRGMLPAMRGLGVLGHKHVPPEYMRSSPAQRLALIQGLMDTDGHVSPTGQAEFCNTSRAIADSFRELVRSMGVKASLYECSATLNGRDVGPKYRVCFYMADCCRLPRKAARCRSGVKHPGTFLTFEPCATADTSCIQVAGGLYLAGRSMTVTHNSTIISRFFPAWLLGRDPSRHIIAASYGQQLADSMSRDCKHYIGSIEYKEVFPATAIGQPDTNREWKTTAGGHYLAAGREAATTGHGANFIVVDDPFASRQESYSEVVRESVWNWFNSVIRTRRRGRAPLVVLHTRWHEDDLIGRLRREGGWEALTFQAIQHDGTALWPEVFPLAQLEENRKNWPYDFAAMYQQTPMPEGGGIFQSKWFRYFKREGETMWDADGGIHDIRNWRRFATVDVAVTTKTSSDWTVIAVWAMSPAKQILLLDLKRVRVETPDLLGLLARVRPEWGVGVIYIESNGVGTPVFQMSAARGLPVVPIEQSKDKAERAHAATPWFARGAVWFDEQAPYRAELERELLNFPAAAHDDQCDAVSMAVQVADSGLGVVMRSEAGIARAATAGYPSLNGTHLRGDARPHSAAHSAATRHGGYPGGNRPTGAGYSRW